MNTKMMLGALMMSLTAVACMGPEIERGEELDESVGEVSSALQTYDVTVVAWVDQGEIKTTTYCTDFDLVQGSNFKCKCDGIADTGAYYSGDPTKCKLCQHSQWPCHFEMDQPAAGSVSITFNEGGNGHASYLKLNGNDEPVVIDQAQTLGCGAQEELDFAIVRSWTNPNPAEILAKGDMNLYLDGCGS